MSKVCSHIQLYFSIAAGSSFKEWNVYSWKVLKLQLRLQSVLGVVGSGFIHSNNAPALSSTILPQQKKKENYANLHKLHLQHRYQHFISLLKLSSPLILCESRQHWNNTSQEEGKVGKKLKASSCRARKFRPPPFLSGSPHTPPGICVCVFILQCYSVVTSTSLKCISHKASHDEV